MKFEEPYFKSLNYTDYLDRKDKYLKSAQELRDLLKSFNLINKKTSIMDYGCAVGFLMEGFHSLGYKKIYGYDISKWATREAKNKGLKILKKIEPRFFNIMICLDVLEHMTDRQIEEVFENYKSDILIVRIPCSIDGKEFALEVSKHDKTHVNCKTKLEWAKLLSSLGYHTILPLNLLTIYDTPGVKCALCLKPNSSYLSQ